MTSSWDKFQELMKIEMRKKFSEPVVEHSMNPKNLGVLDEPDGFARITGPCGDTMSIWLKIKDNTITELSFTTDGCSTTIASGSMVTEMSKGKTIVEAQKTTQSDVLKALEGLPEENEHCALLATNTLMEAIKDYQNVKEDPWKKAYRKQSG